MDEPWSFPLCFLLPMSAFLVAYVHIYLPVGEKRTPTGLVGFGTFGADAGGYVRVAGAFPYPATTHSQYSKSAADITLPRLAITE